MERGWAKREREHEARGDMSGRKREKQEEVKGRRREERKNEKKKEKPREQTWNCPWMSPPEVDAMSVKLVSPWGHGRNPGSTPTDRHGRIDSLDVAFLDKHFQRLAFREFKLGRALSQSTSALSIGQVSLKILPGQDARGDPVRSGPSENHVEEVIGDDRRFDGGSASGPTFAPGAGGHEEDTG